MDKERINMNKFALHTATNYTGTHMALRGCLNDWHNFQKLDNELGITNTANIVNLTETAYRRDLVLEALNHLATVTKPGDLVLWSNSSHGVQVRNPYSLEQDFIDEALVDHYGKLILDDEIGNAIDKFKNGVTVIVWLDNCYAGTMDRHCRLDNWHVIQKRVACDAVMLMGCRENQTSADAHIKGQFQGAMTYFSLEALRAAKMDLTYRELLERTNRGLREKRFPQVAQMAVSTEQLLDKKVFTTV